MKERDLLAKMANAIAQANINHPLVSDGTHRPQIVMTDKDSRFLAGVALRAIRDAGCVIAEEVNGDA